ncbi:unnamed protein product [Symbiodinium natans]|uniref:C3H1-type domain-containing protein n=1 Tax=Symbiodinium natans TaxID=878477 RepID=A0A812JSS4_9DINO|nr:unnamed protein product [Symbiodinium natans]
MPRGHGRRRRKEVEEDSVEAVERAQRTVIFSKTKMCKFHILGACTKGDGCKFAHRKDELQDLPDLACTKLCKMLISTGSCDDPTCRYAHNRAELKEIPGLPSPLMDQLRETEASQLADAAKAAAKAAIESNNPQRQKSNEEIQRKLRQHLSLLEQTTSSSKQPNRVQEAASSSVPTGLTLQAVPATLAPGGEMAQLFPVQLGGAFLSPTPLEGGLLVNLSSMVAAQVQAPTVPWAAPLIAAPTQPAPIAASTGSGTPAPTPKSEVPQPAKTKALPSKASAKACATKQEKRQGHKSATTGHTIDHQPPGKVLSLASELPKPDTPLNLDQRLQDQVQHHLQLQLQQQQEIQRQLRTQLSNQPPKEKRSHEPNARSSQLSTETPSQEPHSNQALQTQTASSSPSQEANRFAVKHTSHDADADAPTPTAPYHRINTWSGGLNEMEEDLLNDPVLELGPLDKVEQATLQLGPSPKPQKDVLRGLHCVPENQRLNGMGRQISECSETSVTSTDTPTRTEKRHQDTPLGWAGRRPDSRGSSPFSAVHEAPELEDEDCQALDEDGCRPQPQELGHISGPISPNTKLHQEFGAVVKNTFLEVQDEEEQDAPKLRLVQTAAGRLDSMGGLPSNPSFETLM